MLPPRASGGDWISCAYRACTRLLRALHCAAIQPPALILRRDRDQQATEVGTELKLVTPHELATLILSGEFVLQLHIGALLLAGMRGHLDLAGLR